MTLSFGDWHGPCRLLILRTYPSCIVWDLRVATFAYRLGFSQAHGPGPPCVAWTEFAPASRRHGSSGDTQRALVSPSAVSKAMTDEHFPNLAYDGSTSSNEANPCHFPSRTPCIIASYVLVPSHTEGSLCHFSHQLAN